MKQSTKSVSVICLENYWFFFSEVTGFPMLPIRGTWILVRALRPTKTMGIQTKTNMRRAVRRVGVKSWYLWKMPFWGKGVALTVAVGAVLKVEVWKGDTA